MENYRSDRDIRLLHSQTPESYKSAHFSQIPSDKTDAISQLNTGRVPVGIANASVFHVLRTGGTGTVMFVVGGLAILLGAGFWFMKMNSKKSDDDAEEEAQDE